MSIYQTVAKMIADRAWQPGKGMSAWDSDRNYSGASLAGWVVGLSRTRDSDLLTNSNFDVLLERLGGGSEGKVETVRIGHWACGWVDQIVVHMSAGTELEILWHSLNALQEYPVLDESDFHEAEEAYKQACMEDYFQHWAKSVAKYLGVETESFDSYQLINVLWVLYEEECGYHGTEEAYINTADMPRLVKSCWHELKALGDAGNSLAAQLLRKQK